ncbi:MAG TPA: hypothetical protein VN256_08265 [Pyrinomonadaceae bacterium]|nr:hypothetical protein [Pyrinomonadaceae bacterium]
MNVISDERRRQILESLGSAVCEACGGPKEPKLSHCGSCFYRLSPAIRKALYLPFGKGYEHAYEGSLRVLGAGRPAARTERPKCRRCQAPLIFAKQNPTERNQHPSNNPLNAEPHPDGNLRLDRATMRYDVLTGDELREARARGEALYLSHFVDCPYRQQFRKATA